MRIPIQTTMGVVFIPVEVGTPIPVPGLCTQCWLPSLYTVTAHVLTDHAVEGIATITACESCGPTP